jgi:kumamolisin
LIARINSSTPRAAGFVNPTLYRNPKDLRDITKGTNGAFAAQPGWDACTGLGSPNGVPLAGVL